MQTFEICLLLAVLSQVTLFVTAATCAVSDSDQATFSADGVCDSGLNTDGCGWDGGDCCRQSCVEPFDTNGCPRFVGWLGGVCTKLAVPGTLDRSTYIPSCMFCASCLAAMASLLIVWTQNTPTMKRHSQLLRAASAPIRCGDWRDACTF